MIKINNYKPIEYKELQLMALKARNESTLSNIDLCVAMEVRSVVTVRNGLSVDQQPVSDEVLTKLHKALGIESLVTYNGGVKQFYVKNKKLKNEG